MTKIKNPVLSSIWGWKKEFLIQKGIKTDRKLIAIFVNNRKFNLNRKYIETTISKNRTDNMILHIAESLYKFKYIDKQELDKQYPIDVYKFHGSSLRKLKSIGIYKLGDAVNDCINKDGEYKRFKGAAATNYHLAKLLFKLEFLSQEEFNKVPKVSKRLMVPTKDEIGKDGERFLMDINFEESGTIWTPSLKQAILVAVTVHYRYKNTFGNIHYWHWEEIKILHLVQTFVRIKSEVTFFKSTGHIAWQWMYYDPEKLKLVILEVENILKQLNYLE